MYSPLNVSVKSDGNYLTLPGSVSQCFSIPAGSVLNPHYRDCTNESLDFPGMARPHVMNEWSCLTGR
jgi:hypothetical protein